MEENSKNRLNKIVNREERNANQLKFYKVEVAAYL